MLKQETQTQLMLTTLRTRLLMMCSAASFALDGALEALEKGNMGMAASVIEADTTIDNLEVEIDNLAMSFLVRTQPMASDLRFVVSALRMVNDIERIGDEAVVIAERVTTSQGQSTVEMLQTTNKLALLAKSLLAQGIACFRENDAELALAICKLDDEIAQEEVSTMQRIMSKATDASLDAYTAMHSLLLCRALTRICRRSLHLGEHTYFMLKGNLLKHQKK